MKSSVEGVGGEEGGRDGGVCNGGGGGVGMLLLLLFVLVVVGRGERVLGEGWFLCRLVVPTRPSVMPRVP